MRSVVAFCLDRKILKELEVKTSGESLIRVYGEGDRFVDVMKDIADNKDTLEAVVLGSEFSEPVQMVQRVHAIDKTISVLVLVEPSDLGRIQHTFQFSPFIGDQVQCIPDDNLNGILMSVSDAIKKTREKRRHSKVVSHLNSSLKSFAPSVVAQSKFYFDKLLDFAPVAIAIVSRAGKVLAWNQKARNVTGLNERDVVARDFASVLSMPSSIEWRTLLVDDTSSIAFEASRKHAGSVRHFDCTAGLLEQDSNQCIMVVFNDVTEQKVAGERLLESEANLRASIDSSAGGFYGVDRNGVTTVCNTAFLHMLGFERMEDVVGKKLHDIIHHTHPDGTPYAMEESPIYRAASNGTPGHVEDEFFFRLDGSSFPVEYWTTPIVRNNEVWGAVTTFIDITKRKQSDLALRAAKQNAERLKEEAERANDLKSAFLANMSHEIRTPLGAMMGFADLLRDPGLTPTERSSYVDVLSRNGESLSVIINDILDLSKVEAGHLTLEYSDTYPEQIGADVVSLLRVKAKEKDLVLEYSFDETSSDSIVADPTRVRQILINLVGNAIKFTQFGSVKLRSYGCTNDSGRAAICFEVSDTGIGIPESQKERVFEMFVQADGTMTRRFGGTGLGLALSRRLAREMGGDVSIVKTKEGVGTTFLIKIEDQPQKRSNVSAKDAKQEKPQQIEIGDHALEGIKILVVDDAPDNQQLIWRYLTRRGAIVESAENGLVGYRTALSGDFDIVLMDIQMPVMDGYTATSKLRENGYKKPILALTAHAMSEVRKKALNVGYTDHLPKPINSKELIEAIIRHTSSRLRAF